MGGCKCDKPACNELRGELEAMTTRCHQLAAHIEIIIELDEVTRARGKELERAMIAARGAVTA